MPVKVSVVVPVWNPGHEIDRCIRSLLGAVAPARRVRGDLRRRRLDRRHPGPTRRARCRASERACRAHPELRLAGPTAERRGGERPRRVRPVRRSGRSPGARSPRAPLRLRSQERGGHRHRAGRERLSARGVHALGVFTRNRPSCSIHDAPLIDTLTVHKLFRRAFLRSNSLAFPEGKRRLEDQLFMVQAYFRGASVAILADYPCYFYRPARRTSGTPARRSSCPIQYFGNLREVLADRDRQHRAGRRRDATAPTVRPGGDPRPPERADLPRHDDGVPRELVAAARAVLVDLLDPEVEADWAGVRRLRAHLLETDGRRPCWKSPVAFRRTGCLVASPCAWDRGRLSVGFKVGIRRDDGVWLPRPASAAIGTSSVPTSPMGLLRTTSTRDRPLEWRCRGRPSGSAIRPPSSNGRLRRRHRSSSRRARPRWTGRSGLMPPSDVAPALERLRDDADIVIGKVTSDFREVPFRPVPTGSGGLHDPRCAAR